MTHGEAYTFAILLAALGWGLNQLYHSWYALIPLLIAAGLWLWITLSGPRPPDPPRLRPV